MLTTTPKGQATSSCQQDSEARLTSRSSLKILKIIGVFYFCCDTRIVHISPTFLIMDWDLHPFVAFSNVDSVRQRYHECCLKSMCIMSYMCVEFFFKANSWQAVWPHPESSKQSPRFCWLNQFFDRSASTIASFLKTYYLGHIHTFICHLTPPIFAGIWAHLSFGLLTNHHVWVEPSAGGKQKRGKPEKQLSRGPRSGSYPAGVYLIKTP